MLRFSCLYSFAHSVSPHLLRSLYLLRLLIARPPSLIIVIEVRIVR